MNKRRSTCLLLAALIVGCGFVVIRGCNEHRGYLLVQADMAGRELIAEANSTRVIHVGPQVEYRLESLRKHPSGLSEVLSGDEPDFGDGKASNRIILTNSMGERLGIRLRWDAASKKFHILGYWTPH